MSEQLGRTTRLSAVNLILRSIGEREVSTLVNSTRGDVSGAVSELDNTSRIVQQEGWHFNHETRTLGLQSDGRIQVPVSALAIGVLGSSTPDEIIMRGEHFFNKTDSTYTFTDTIKVDLIFHLPFDDLPEPARQYIAARAARRVAQQRVGDQVLIQSLMQDEGTTRLALENEELESADHNIFDSPELSRLHNTWLR